MLSHLALAQQNSTIGRHSHLVVLDAIGLDGADDALAHRDRRTSFARDCRQYGLAASAARSRACAAGALATQHVLDEHLRLGKLTAHGRNLGVHQAGNLACAFNARASLGAGAPEGCGEGQA